MLVILTVLGACRPETPPPSNAPQLPQQAALPETTEGAPYEVSLTATGGTPPLSYSAERVPPGFSFQFQADAALLKGPAIAAGRYSLTVQVRDSQGAGETRTYELYVHTAPSVRTATLPSATVGKAYTQRLEASGGRPPLRWSVASGLLPLGLSLTEEGLLTGTPLEPSSYAFTVRARDASGAQATRPLSLSVQPGQGDGGSPDGGSPDGGGTDGGTSVPLRVGNWNIEWFGSPTEGPTDEQLQLDNARTVLASAEVDFWGLAEIVSTEHFNALKQLMPGYQGFLANDTQWVSSGWWHYTTNEQKVGVLFRSDTVQVLSAEVILTDYDYQFASRPPLRVDLRFTRNGVTVDLVAIVLHLKATTNAPPTDYQRRKDASLLLQQYLDTNLPTARVLVVGDWNDDLDQSIVKDSSTGQYLETPFKNFLQAPADYTFTTLPLATSERSTVSYSSFIDHQLTSNELAEDYVPHSAYALKPALTNYGITTSDHYPVISRFDFGHLPPAPLLPPLLELRLTSPNGGESFPAGTVQDITWRADGGTFVRLAYSVDDGATWQDLGVSVPAGAGRYTVTLPTEDQAQVRVRVSDSADSGLADMSDAPFAVTW
jgi:endonuclease/exonuclease/phosphatase family metal-dependent hydrolase